MCHAVMMSSSRGTCKSAVIGFDMDGVLVDSGRSIKLSLERAVFEVTGARPVHPVDDSFIGPPLRESLERLIGPREPAVLELCINAYRRINDRLSSSMTAVFPEVQTMLASLGRSFELVVVTSKLEASARHLLSSLDLSGHFVGIHGVSSDGIKEQKVDTLRRAISEHGRLETLIGDRTHDVQAALALGVRPIGVTWGYGTRQELINAGAEHLATNPSELAKLVMSILS